MNAAAQLTYPGIGLVVFGQQFCLPLPSMLLLMTAGALAAQGQGHLNLSLVVLTGMIGCLAADGFWFWLGRRWGSGVIRVVCSFTMNPRASRERSRRIFDKWGLRLLLVAKFIPGLDGVSPPLAGASGATVRAFAVYDTAGSLLWTGAFVLLGYLFSRQIDPLIAMLSRFGKFLLIGAGVPLLCYVVWRAMQLVRVIRQLRLRRISPELLASKMETSEKLAIFDLLDYEAEDGTAAGIPGSLRVDPDRLRNIPPLGFPDGLEVVVYCSSKNEFVSARVAEALQKAGFPNVWVLEGGLEAWVSEGRPVTLERISEEELGDRVGILLLPPNGK